MPGPGSNSKWNLSKQGRRLAEPASTCARGGCSSQPNDRLRRARKLFSASRCRAGPTPFPSVRRSRGCPGRSKTRLSSEGLGSSSSTSRHQWLPRSAPSLTNCVRRPPHNPPSYSLRPGSGKPRERDPGQSEVYSPEEPCGKLPTVQLYQVTTSCVSRLRTAAAANRIPQQPGLAFAPHGELRRVAGGG